MKKADLHCHSIFSEHPTEWFLQKLGARESYTDPHMIYQEAKRMGMDYVTITDHNRIDGALIIKEKYPREVIVGVEATTYFPEDMCKIHVLIYGLKESQFEAVNHIRKDIYELRDYLAHCGLVHSVAHASYSVNGKLKQHHLEKLVLLFDYFEAVNGGRNRHSNNGWKYILENLNEDLLFDLYKKHRIEPFGREPWKKGYTGGSDDHGALFIGQTYTQVRATDIDEFLAGIAHKRSMAMGRHNTYHALAFTVYKIAYDFSRSQGSQKKGSLLSAITENLFENRSPDMKNRLKLKTMRGLADLKGNELKILLGDLVQTLQDKQDIHFEDKLDLVYTHISDIADAFFRVLLNSLEDDLKDMNFIKLVRNIGMSLPGIFLLLPFFSSLKHMHQTQVLVSEFRRTYGILDEQRKKRTLWFTDTINDLNGVSITLKQMGQIAHEKGRELRIVSSLSDNEFTSEIPENYMNLPFMYVFRLPYYENYRIKVPSILKCLKMINDYEPDQIIVSTPGPIGLLALLAAKLIRIPVMGIYHTDFCGEASHIISDESASGLVKEYEKWFYNQMDEIRTPTNEYKRILMDRNICTPSMKLLKRGIELEQFAPLKDRKHFLISRLDIRDGITLLYAGRVSKDKSLNLLVEVYHELIGDHPDLNLVIAGNGPYLSEMKEALACCPRVIFTGAIPRDQLPGLYNSADFFVFPSVTDTFGMVILECQACGLPAIVSKTGGPKELIVDGKNGFIVSDQKPDSWVQTIDGAISIYRKQPAYYQQMREESRANVIGSSDWDYILDDLLGSDGLNS